MFKSLEGIYWTSRRKQCQHPDHDDTAAMGRKVAEYHITLEKSKQLFIQQGICLAVGEGT